MEGPVLSHLQFADDVLIFCEGSMVELRNVKRILKCFELMSGLQINFGKSSISGVGVGEHFMNEAAGVLSCKNCRMPFKYLGLSVGSRWNVQEVWKGVVERIKNSLTVWKRNLLSFGGRLTLLKSVIANIPVYCMSLFKLPRKVAIEIGKMQRSFLWKGQKGKRGIHCVQWTQVSSSKQLGGLGIRSVTDMNKALLLKWWWRFGREKNSLWRRVINGKYKSSNSQWLPKINDGTKYSRTWTDILKAGLEQQQGGWKMKQNLIIRLGNGEDTLFWKDQWLQGGSMQELFPRLFRFSVHKAASVAEVFRQNAEGICESKFEFRRQLFRWEEDLKQDMMVMMSSVELRSERRDSLWWRDGIKPEEFSVSRACTKLENLKQLPPNEISLVWNIAAAAKLQCFGWLALQDKIKTRAFLINRGILPAESNAQCVLCNEGEETSTHLLLHYKFAWHIWSSILNWWGIQWSSNGTLMGHARWWMGLKYRNLQKKIWENLFLSIIWHVWLFRNAVIFHQKEAVMDMCIDEVKLHTASWIKANMEEDLFSISDFFYSISGVKRLTN